LLVLEGGKTVGKPAFDLDLAAAAMALKREIGFAGGHRNRFEKIGRHSYETALALGLKPEHKFLDFGAGALRLGYWFVRYLEPGNYHAIEPSEKMMEGGKKILFGPDILRDKSPTFYVSDKCDMTTLGVPFDFVIARSILTHTHPGMLHLILDEFSKCASPRGIFLASYWASNGEHAYRKVGDVGDDMSRDDAAWGGTIKFSLAYLQAAAAEHGLTAEDFGILPPENDQVWAVFRKG
jgi:SAM-dependent methyltransferase